MGITAPELLEEAHDLVDDLGVARLDALDHAGLEVVLHDLARDRLDGGLDGRELREDVAAVAVLLDHGLYAVELPDRAVDAARDIGLELGRARRVLAASAVAAGFLSVFGHGSLLFAEQVTYPMGVLAIAECIP